MSDTTRIAAYWRERTIHDHETIERQQLQADRDPFVELEEILRADPLEAARIAREVVAGSNRGA
jgi:hypothetical protein